MNPPTLREIYAARLRIAPHVRRTPLVLSDWLSAETGGSVYLKLESLQVTHSFKARGAVNATVALTERSGGRRDLPSLVTASAGNAGRALAYAAGRLGLSSIVFTPRDAPRTKLEAIRRLGADLRAEAGSYEEAEWMAKRFASSSGLPYLSPYSHPDVIAGVGTIALEVLEELPDADVILAPLGGGGLLSGLAIAAKAVSPSISIVGVEAEASTAFTAALAAGRIVEVPVGPTVADGLAGNMDPDTITFAIVQRLADAVVIAPEEQILRAIAELAAEEHLIAEGAGAAAVAAILAGKIAAGGKRVVAVVSGANIDATRLREVLATASGFRARESV